MGQEGRFVFGPFCLDAGARRLWRSGQEIALQAQPLAVLRCLVERGGRLVTKEELLRDAWPGTWVSKTSLKVCVHTIRAALGDDVASPRYIETVGRLGYRFLRDDGGPAPTARPVDPETRPVVARERDLQRLRDIFDRTRRGSRQLVFVTGEPGIGKTTLADLFLADVVARGEAIVARGQCFEQYDGGEPYLPVLEAVAQLCRGVHGRATLETLRRFAPTWVVQMPALVSDAELEGMRRKVAGATRDRMLREMAEALEALSEERSVVLLFEDLHWSDRSTVDLLAYLARRREPARLLILGTYRSVDLVVSDHPLKRVRLDLRSQGLSAELPLELLAEDDVAGYIARRWGTASAPPGLAKQVHERSDGNPLFMVHLVDHHLRQPAAESTGDAGTDDVPESLQQVIEQQIGTLPDYVRQVLDAGSVAGMEFCVAQIAAALGGAADEVEDVCDELAHAGRFLREAGVAEWPDGTLSGQYHFRHALYRSVVYQRLPEARRARLHRAIGECVEAAHGERAGEIAGALALHFERGRDERRAFAYRRRAAANAIQRNAYHEAIEHLERAVALLQMRPSSPERSRDDLDLTLALAPLLQYTRGYAAPETEDAYTRARALSGRVDDPVQRFTTLLRFAYYSLIRTRLGEARDVATQCLAIARTLGDPQQLADAHHALGCTLFWLGALAAARDHLEQCVAMLDPRQHRWTPFGSGMFAPGTLAVGQLGWTHWLLGHPDQGVAMVHRAVGLARELGYALNLGSTLAFAATVHQQRREVDATAEYVELELALARREGFPHWLLDGGLKRAWVLAARGEHGEAHTELDRLMAALQGGGRAVAQSYHVALAAEVFGIVGKAADGIGCLGAWLDAAPPSEERYYDAELHRLYGELVRQTAGKKRSRANADAEEHFRFGLAIAREQGARALELRLATSLARLWRDQRKHAEARALVGQVQAQFDEGLATSDLRDAQALLDVPA